MKMPISGRNDLTRKAEDMHNRHENAKSTLNSQIFKEACDKVGIPPTMRQARKWNNKKGAAYKGNHRIEMNGYVYPV